MRRRTLAAMVVLGLCVTGLWLVGVVAWAAPGDGLPAFVRFGATCTSSGFCATIRTVQDESCHGLSVRPHTWQPDGASALTISVAPDRNRGALATWIAGRLWPRHDGEVYVRLHDEAQASKATLTPYVRTGLSAAAVAGALPDVATLLERAREHIGADRFDALVREQN